MARLRRFFSLSKGERALFARAVWLMTAVQVALWFLPLRRVTSQLEKVMIPNRFQPAETIDPARVVKRLEQAARFCPVRATCLVQALVSRVLLMECGFPAKIRVGVRKSGAGIEAHAWLECPGSVIVGDAAPAGRTFVPVVGAERLVE